MLAARHRSAEVGQARRDRQALRPNFEFREDFKPSTIGPLTKSPRKLFKLGRLGVFPALNSGDCG
jgi:hypothetical protein